jgi:hypothetical protein
MSLLQEHNVYLEAMSAALSTYMQALAGALEVQDNPGEYTISSFQSARDQLAAATNTLNSYIAGQGNPGNSFDALKIYKSPSTLTGGVTITLGNASALGANIPQIIP